MTTETKILTNSAQYTYWAIPKLFHSTEKLNTLEKVC